MRIEGFYSDPRWKAMHDSKDLDEKLRYAAELHAGDAPWLGEPHRKEWKHKGLDCLIVRNPNIGALCGYVGVPPTHPYFGKGYDTVHDIDTALMVHGGLTYADTCQGHICHKVLEGEKDEVWWLGFDCAHVHDWSPFMMKHTGDSYKTMQFVTEEVERLAEHLAEVRS